MPRVPLVLSIALSCLVPILLAGGRDKIALPEWNEEELAEPPGERLRWSAMLWPKGEYTPQASDEGDLEDEPPRMPVEVALANMQDLPADLFLKYFTDQPSGAIIDPQHLVTRSRLDGLLTFLDFHHQEARSRICLMVLGANHRVPSAVDLEELHQRWFGDSLTALAIYNFGNPEMSRIVYGKKAEGQVAESMLRDSCLESISESLDATNAEEQLERFLTELSRRLYWVEAAFHGEEHRQAQTRKEAARSNGRIAMPSTRAAALRAGLIGISALFALGALLVYLQRRAAHRAYYFPDRGILPRLGAPYGGGSRLLVTFRRKPEERRHW